MIEKRKREVYNEDESDDDNDEGGDKKMAVAPSLIS